MGNIYSIMDLKLPELKYNMNHKMKNLKSPALSQEILPLSYPLQQTHTHTQSPKVISFKLSDLSIVPGLTVNIFFPPRFYTILKNLKLSMVLKTT